MENGKRTTTYENEGEKERIDGNEDEELKRRVKTIMLQQIMIMMIIKSKFEVSLNQINNSPVRIRAWKICGCKQGTLAEYPPFGFHQRIG